MNFDQHQWGEAVTLSELLQTKAPTAWPRGHIAHVGNALAVLCSTADVAIFVPTTGPDVH